MKFLFRWRLFDWHWDIPIDRHVCSTLCTSVYHTLLVVFHSSKYNFWMSWLQEDGRGGGKIDTWRVILWKRQKAMRLKHRENYENKKKTFTETTKLWNMYTKYKFPMQRILPSQQNNQAFCNACGISRNNTIDYFVENARTNVILVMLLIAHDYKTTHFTILLGIFYYYWNTFQKSLKNVFRINLESSCTIYFHSVVAQFDILWIIQRIVDTKSTSTKIDKWRQTTNLLVCTRLIDTWNTWLLIWNKRCISLQIQQTAKRLIVVHILSMNYGNVSLRRIIKS